MPCLFHMLFNLFFQIFTFSVFGPDGKRKCGLKKPHKYVVCKETPIDYWTEGFRFQWGFHVSKPNE